MTARAFSIRPKADAEFDEALDRYLLEAGAAIAERFVGAVEDAHNLIAEAPGVGAPGLGLQMAIDGLRVWKIGGFPYLVVYLESDAGVEILRLLHVHRDVPSVLIDDLE